ncbi:MAG: SDR family NAD(P)-dependent oxidoreductase [Deltaproteobacteria bacterium]|nr:MAG: SDR family NAD(P)-dependent oxidoreductase [Deltaproteobacteria bacterium]
MARLSGRVVAVTGAGSGIGAALAGELAREGAVLALSDVREEALAVVAGRLREAGAQVHDMVVDVGEADAVLSWATAVDRTLGPVSLLYNNAGMTVYGAFEEHSLEDFDAVLRVNLHGVLHGCRAFLPQLRRSAPSMVVNISSLFGLIGVPGQTAYCTSKYAVRGFSDALREELRGSGVSVLCVHPGGVATNIVRDARLASGLAEERSPLPRVVRMFERHGMAPAEAARRIVRASLRGRSRLVITREAHAFDVLGRMSPVGGLRMAARLIDRLGGGGRQGSG